MPNSNENIGGISVSIAVGLQDLQAQLNQAQQMSDAAGKAMAAAFNTATSSANQLSIAVQGVGTSAGTAASGFSELAGSLTSIGAKLVTFGALKEIATDSLEAYANLQRATTALTALTGSATTADNEIANLKKLAMDDALSFPELLQANQRLTALGVNANQIPAALRASADAAAAMNTSLINVTNAIDRMAASGSVAGRNLTQLGLTTNDLAKVMGVSLDQLGKAFHNLDESDRIAYLTEALGKFGGTAEAVAGTLQGSFNRLQNTITFAFQSIGESIAPAAKDLTDLAVDVIPHLASGFSQLAAPAVSVIELGSSLGALKVQIIDTVAAIVPFGPEFKVAAIAATDTKASFLDLDPAMAAVRDGAIALTKAVRAYTDTGPEVDSMNRMIANGLRSVATAAALGGQAFQDAWNLSKIEAGLGNVDNQVRTVVQEQQKAEIAFRASADALTTMSAAFSANKPLADGHIVTLGELARAQADYDTAQRKANAGSKDYQDTLSGLTEAYRKNQGTIDTLTRSITQLLAIQDRSVAQESILDNALAKRWELIQKNISALKDQMGAENDAAAAASKMVKTADDFLTHEQAVGIALANSKSVLDQLTASNDKSAEHQRAVNDAIQQYSVLLKQSGQALTDQIGIQVNGVTVLTTVGDALNKAKEAQSQFTTTVENGVEVTRSLPEVMSKAHDAYRHAGDGASSAATQVDRFTASVNASVDTSKPINYYSSLAASIQHVGEATVDSTAVNDAWNDSIVTSVDNASRFANKINQVTEALHNMATAEDEAGTASFDADKSFKATTGSVNALSVGVSLLAMQLSGLTIFAGSGIDYSKGQSDLQHQLYLAQQMAGDPIAQGANFVTAGKGPLKGQSFGSLDELNQALDDLKKNSDAATKATTATATATKTNTAALTDKASANTTAASATTELTDATGGLTKALQQASVTNNGVSSDQIKGLQDQLDAAEKASAATGHYSQQVSDLMNQLDKMRSQFEGGGGIMSAGTLLPQIVEMEQTANGVSTKQIQAMQDQLDAAEKLAAATGHYSQQVSDLMQKLSDLQWQFNGSGAMASSPIIPTVIQGATTANGVSSDQIASLQKQLAQAAKDSNGHYSQAYSDLYKELSDLEFKFRGGSPGSVPASTYNSYTQANAGVPVNPSWNTGTVKSNQQNGVNGQGIVVNLNYPQFNSQQQADQVMKQVVTQLRTITGLKI